MKNRANVFFLLTVTLMIFLLQPVLSVTTKTKPNISVSQTSSEYSIDLNIKNIPVGQQTLFVPLKIDTMIFDIDKVVIDGLASQNILALASTSKDKAGPGIGLLKFDEKGLPQVLPVKVFLRPVGIGETTVSLLMVTDEPSLPSKGLVINDGIKVISQSDSEIQVSEGISPNNKKKLTLSKNLITLNVQRQSQKEETIFIPLIFDKNIIDIDETFGHAIIGPGIAAKAFGSTSLDEGGAGVEIILTEAADKDFSLNVDLLPRKVGKSKLTVALPQISHTAIVIGPEVDINPTKVSVNK